MLRCGALGGGTFGGGTFGHRLFRGTLRGGALRERSLRLGATLCCSALRLGSLQRCALGGRLLRGGAQLLLRSSLLGRAALLDRAVHRGAFFGGSSFFLGAALGRGATLFLGAPFVFRSSLDGRALFGEATLRGGALFLRATLRCGLLDGRAFCGRALRGGALLARALFFLRAPLHRGLTFLDRALECRVLGRGALLFFGSSFLRETSLLRGALRRGAVLGRASLVELARFSGRATLLGRAFRRGAFFRGTLFRGTTIGRGTFGSRQLLSRASLFFGAPLFGGATILCGACFGRAHFRGDALLFREARFLRRAPLFLGRALRLDASRLFRDPFLFCLLRERRVVDGEDLFVLEDREGLVVFDLTRFLDDRWHSALERLTRCRRFSYFGRGRDRLVDRRPGLLDTSCGLRRRGRRGVLDRRGRRATVLVDQLFEETTQRIGRRGAELGSAGIDRGRAAEGRDRAAALLSDVVLQLIVFLAQALDLFEEHPALFARLLQDLGRRRLRPLPDLVCGA